MKKHITACLLLSIMLCCLLTPATAQEVVEEQAVPQQPVQQQQQETTPTTPATVQVLPFGYLSFSSVFVQMPEYAQAQQDFAALKAKYEAEATRAEDEFQRKFADFLQGQKDFPTTILQKRQAELQDLMEKSISFRQESQRMLEKAEKEMQQPLVDKLKQAINEVGNELGLMFVVNTDDNACPFIHPSVGVDVTAPVLTRLGLITTTPAP